MNQKDPFLQNTPIEQRGSAVQMLTGQDLQHAFLDGHAGKLWEDLHPSLQIDYEMTAQALSVRLGLLPETAHLYLLVIGEERVLPAEDADDLALLIEAYGPHGDSLEIHILQAGRKVGKGFYHLLEDRTLWESSWKAAPEGMAQGYAAWFNAWRLQVEQQEPPRFRVTFHPQIESFCVVVEEPTLRDAKDAAYCSYQGADLSSFQIEPPKTEWEPLNEAARRVLKLQDLQTLATQRGYKGYPVSRSR
jgi:hypothetical protein